MVAIDPLDRLNIVGLESKWAFVGCWASAVALLYLAGSPLGEPAVFPDEVCRLGWARFFSGTGPHFEMSPSSYCQPYYSLLLSPFFWFTSDSIAIHRGVFAVNTAIAAGCLPIAVRLGVRHFNLNIGTAWFAGLLILAYPSLTLYSYHAMPETALFLGVLISFSAWCAWVDRPDWPRFAALLAMSFILFVLHRKMLVVPVVLIVGAIGGYWFVRTPEYRQRALLSVLALCMAFLIDYWLKNALFAKHFQGGDGGAVEMLARFSSVRQIKNSIGISAGVLVYATFITGGLIWLLLASGLENIRQAFRSGMGSLDKFTLKSGFAFGMVVLLVGVTAASFGSGSRFDIWFYGRHVDATLGAALLPVVAIIAEKRVTGSVLAWVLVLPMVTFIALTAFNPGPPWSDFSQIHVIGAGSMMDRLFEASRPWNLLAYCAAILALAGVIFLVRLPGLFRFSMIIPFLLVTATTHISTEPFSGIPLDEAVSESAAEILSGTDPCHIRYDTRGGGRFRLHQYFRLQYHFPHCAIELTPPEKPIEPDSFVVVVKSFVDCGSGIECHDLHPDLVLYRTLGR